MSMRQECTTFMSGSTWPLCLLLSAPLFGCLPALAQDAPIIRTHVTEVGGFVGATYGVDHSRVMGGGNVVYSLTRVIMPFVEVSYFPGIDKSAAGTTPGSHVKYSVPITDFNSGFHVRVPIPRSRIVPYGLVAVGGLRENPTTLVTITPNGHVVVPVQRPASLLYATSFGGGVRYYLNERLGFRAEAKGYIPAGSDSLVKIGHIYRVAIGVFFQF